MNKVAFATSNKNKLYEVRSLGIPGLEIVGLSDFGFEGELPETHDTLEENSLEKAEYFSNKFNVPCFAEDTGLFISALSGRPGVYSARYAGPEADSQKNMEKVLQELGDKKERVAYFKTIFTYFSNGEYVQFEGITEGTITKNSTGIHGFGYDPIFIPEGADKTYAEMDLNEKNIYSHRKKSFSLLANHLQKTFV